MTATAPLPSFNASSSAQPRQRIAQFATAISLIAGLIFRWLQLGKRSLWFDEGYTAWVVSHPVRELVRLIGADTAPPGYYILLRGWVTIFGTSEGALRSMSALASSLALLVFWRVAVRLLATPAAVAVAVAVFAFGFMQVGYAHECRFYAMMSLLGVVDFYLVMLICQQSTAARILALGICWSISLYLNNVMAIYLACLGVAWQMLPGHRPIRGRLIDAAVVTAIAAAAFAPWVPRVLAQSKALNGNFWPDTPTVWLVVRTIAIFTGVNERTFDGIDCRGFYWTGPILAGLKDPNQFRYAILIVLVIAVGVTIYLSRTPRWRWPIALIVVGIGPILIVYVYSLIAQPIFMDRAFMGSSFAVPLLVALPWAMARRAQRTEPSGYSAGSSISDFEQIEKRRPGGGAARLRWGEVRLGGLRWGWTILLGIMIAPSLWAQRLSEHAEDWRTLSALARPHPGRRQLTVFVANEGELLYDYYVRRGDYDRASDQTGTPADYFAIDPPHTMIRVKTDADLDALRRRLDQHDFDEVVLVASHRWFADHDDRTFKLLNAKYGLTESWTTEQIIAEYRFDARQ